jgi:O-succinylbenzoic acid--CoA ligase
MLEPARLDGSAEKVEVLREQLAAALDGGPAILPFASDPAPTITTTPDPDTAVVIATTGSSGEPKLVQLSAAALRASAEATAERHGGPAR